MPDSIKINFAKLPAAPEGILILFAGEGGTLGPSAEALLAPAGDLLTRAAAAERFEGKAGSALDLVAPAGLKATRLIVAGVGKPGEMKPFDWLKLGGAVMGRLPASAREAAVLLDVPGNAVSPEAAAEFALGLRLRAYSFDRYKTKKKPEDQTAKPKVTIHIADEAAAKRAWRRKEGIGEGVAIARDLVNEPANVLTPPEFARRTEALEKVGVDVEVLGEKELRKLGMRALLGVGQGSVQESRVVVMRWNGAKADAAPVAFIGKGVVFDTGGISIKQAAGMEDMKGDMAGAACVVGLMHALASRKAKVNAVGLIGIVENMPDGNAQRPGDIVTSMSGQTIEIINTDAEGRLVLADALSLLQRSLQAAFHDQSRHPDRRDPGGARQSAGGPVLQRRHAGRPVGRRRGRHRRAPVAHAARQGIRQADRFEIRRHEEYRRAHRRVDHRSAAPASASSAKRPGRISTSPAPR
jgi:leucyl aminopeptidase